MVNSCVVVDSGSFAVVEVVVDVVGSAVDVSGTLVGVVLRVVVRVRRVDDVVRVDCAWVDSVVLSVVDS